MPYVEARIKVKGKHFEIMVDLDEAFKIKNNQGNIASVMQVPQIFTDVKKGNIASKSDLMSAFNTSDIYEIAKKIILSGEVQKTQEFRDAEKEKKIKQVLNLILRNAVDQHGRPFTEIRLQSAIKEIHFNFDNRPPEQQLPDLVKKLSTVIPIRIETKKIRLTIPARLTGQTYGLLKDYKENEEWLANGNLVATLAIPSGMLIDFYEKLNQVAHGAIQAEEIK